MLSAYMDLNLTPTELGFRDQVRAWLAANVPADWEKHRTEDEMLARFEFATGRGKCSRLDGPALRGRKNTAGVARL